MRGFAEAAGTGGVETAAAVGWVTSGGAAGGGAGADGAGADGAAAAGGAAAVLDALIAVAGRFGIGGGSCSPGGPFLPGGSGGCRRATISGTRFASVHSGRP